eukprot:6196829-Pleurochrysis_carterae.AAC.1
MRHELRAAEVAAPPSPSRAQAAARRATRTPSPVKSVRDGRELLHRGSVQIMRSALSSST